MGGKLPYLKGLGQAAAVIGKIEGGDKGKPLYFRFVKLKCVHN